MYNPFIDLYVDQKTKAVLSLMDSLILIIFYSSLTDFYYLGPYLLNLISSIKFVCNSKEITSKIINENFMDINTMICDLIGFFNGFTRALCQDYNCYLGCDAIYNERCFLHLRKNNNDSLLVMCRERTGSNDYFQLKSLGQIKSKQREKIQNGEEEKIEVKSSNIFMFMKLKKNEKKKEYLTFDYNNSNKMKYSYNEENQMHAINGLTNTKMDISTITNYLDLPSESQLFDEEDNEINDENINNGNNNEQILEVFDFRKNVTNKNDKIIISNNKPDKVNKNNFNNKFSLSKSFIKKNENNFDNENEKNYEKFKYRKSHELKNYGKDNTFQNNKKEQNLNRNKSINFDKNLTLKNMELIKNINFDDLNNDELSDDNHVIKEEKNINYDNIIKESLMNNFNQINNNYIDQEISQVFNNKSNNSIYSKKNWNNNYKMNNNNIYYPTQKISNENNFNINNSQSIVPYINPLGNNNSNGNYNFDFNNHKPNQFSQNDLSFLRGYSKSENLKEDFIKINKANPEIISELKEKLCYYYSLFQENKLLNLSLKGYIGINIRSPNIINNKEFYINFITAKWKDNNYYLNREFNNKIEQITENIYKISLLNQKSAVKLITYLVDQNIIMKLNLIKTQIKLS